MTSLFLQQPPSLTHKHAHTHKSLSSLTLSAPLYRLLAWRVETGFRSVQLTHSGSIRPVCLCLCLPVCLLGVRQEALQSLMKVMRKREGGGGGNINCENKYMQITYSIQVCVMDKRMR